MPIVLSSLSNAGGCEPLSLDASTPATSLRTLYVYSFRKGVGILTAFVGLSVLGGWELKVQSLKSIYSSMVSMEPNEAFAFVLCGFALWAIQIPGNTRRISVRRLVAIAAAASVLLVGLLTLLEYLLHVSLGFDEFLFRGPIAGKQFPGRMSLFTVFAFVLIGTALLLLEINRPIARRLSRFASSLSHVIALIVVFGFAYSGKFLYKPSHAGEMAMHTAGLFVLLSAGVLCVRPEEGLAEVLLRRSAGGTVLRCAVPVSLVAAFLLGWLTLEGRRIGLFGTEVGVASLVVTAGAVFVLATAWAARTVDAGAELLTAKQQLPDMLELLVNRIPEYAIMTLDPAGYIATWNLTAERLKGYRTEEVVGKHFSMLYVPEDVASGKPERELKLAARDGRYEDEGWRMRKDGSRFWANVVITVLRSERGELRGFGKITRDLTERKRSEDQFQLAMEAAPTGMILVDQRGKIVLVNAQEEKLFGYERAELLGQLIEVLVPERFRGRHPEFRTNFGVHPQARSMGAGRDLHGLRKDGAEVPIEIALNPLETLEGKLVLTSVIDITERKRAEFEIRQNRDVLEKFVEYAPASIAMFDRNMRYVVASRRWCEDCGLDGKSIIGKNHYEILPTAQEVWKSAHQRGLAGETLKAEDEWVALDGATHTIRWEIHPWGDAGASTGGIVVLIEDVSERKRGEVELRLYQQELRNTLDQLRALSDRVQKAREDERTQVARDLHDQIGQILTAVKMDVDWVAKRLPENQGPLRTKLGATLDLVRDAAQSLRSICTQLRPGVLDDLGLAAAIEWQATEFASRTGIQCDVSVPTEDLDLDADRCTAIFRILQEALTNVARHAEAKVVRASLAQRNGRVLLVVQDDGKGIRDSDLTASKGSLGLLGIRERAQACGGELQIWGEPGTGTTLAVEIPLSDRAQEDGNSAHSIGR